MIKRSPVLKIMPQMLEQGPSKHSIKRRESGAYSVKKFTARSIVNLTKSNHDISKRSRNIAAKRVSQRGKSKSILVDLRQNAHTRHSAKHAKERAGITAGGRCQFDR